MRYSKLLLAVSTLSLGLVTSVAQAVPRTFVSVNGSDANTASNCTTALPCRLLSAAQTVTDSNGEIIVMDSGGYSAITITKSLSIIAPAGVYAGIAPTSNVGIKIATPNIDVVLRGLTLLSRGGTAGVNLGASGGTLLVDRCVFSDFQIESRAITVAGEASVTVVDSLFRNNYINIVTEGGGSLVVSKTNIVGGPYFVTGIAITPPAGKSAVATINDTTINGNIGYGIGIGTSTITAGSSVKLAIARSTITQTSIAIQADGYFAGGQGNIVLSSSVITGNSSGIQIGANNTLQTLGNNTVTLNPVAAGASGTITPLTPF
jgi:hypothetical protein